MFVPSSGGKSSNLPSAASGIGERGAARPQIVGDGFRKSSVISAHKKVWRPRKIRGLIRSGRPIARAWAACMVPAERQFPQGGVVLTAVAARRRPTPSAIQLAISGASPISEPLRVRGAAVAVGSKARGGIPINPRRMANTLNTKPELLREFCGYLAKPKTMKPWCSTPMVNRPRYRCLTHVRRVGVQKIFSFQERAKG